jgi:hypothetical protein
MLIHNPNLRVLVPGQVVYLLDHTSALKPVEIKAVGREYYTLRNRWNTKVRKDGVPHNGLVLFETIADYDEARLRAELWATLHGAMLRTAQPRVSTDDIRQAARLLGVQL